MTLRASRSTVAATLLSTGLGIALLCGTTATRAYAEPPTTSVPDAGSRPTSATPVTPPGGVNLPGAQPSSPLDQQVQAENAAVELIGEQLKQVQVDLEQARRTTLAARKTWDDAKAMVAECAEMVAKDAEEAYKAAVSLGPLGQYASDLHQLSVLAPGLQQMPGSQAAAREQARAEEDERTAARTHQAASDAEQALVAQPAR